MDSGQSKLFSLLLSILFHILVFGIFFYSQFGFEKDSLWSGGRGSLFSNITYIDLGKIEVSSEENQKDDQLDKQNDNQKALVKIKKKEKIPTKIQIEKIVQKKESGVGSSDTPAGGQGPGLDPSGIVSKDAPNILAQIRKDIMQKKRYPVFAKENQWQGTVKVNFKIKESGDLEFVNVIESSGYSILDESAVKSIRNAAPLPYYPQSISLSLEYKLK